MRVVLLCIIFVSHLYCEEEITKSKFPVRLTEQEQEEEAYQNMSSQPGCCKPFRPCGFCNEYECNSCTKKCCPPPSMNCPPIVPRCDPCDCIIDYYNPLVFNGFHLSLEWLYWTVQQKSSTFALTPSTPQPFPPATNGDSIGHYKSAKFDWNSGVRVSLAYTFARDAWNLLGRYTYFGTTGANSSNRPEDPTMYLQPTVRAVASSNTGVDRVRSNQDFDYQIFDLLLSRKFLPGCQILFNFIAGPTAAVITEKWKVTSRDVNGAPVNVTTTTRNNWSFSGGGMRVGFDANWHMGNGFGLYNKSTMATLVGSYYNHRRTTVTPSFNQSLVPNVRNTKESETWVVPATQLEFGLNWNHRFCHWAIQLQGGFEVNSWYDLHQLHQDGQNLQNPNNNFLDYRNASPVNLWGFNFCVNFSF